MGSVLQKPAKYKNSSYEYHPDLEFASCCMRGWRPYMEDAHIAVYPIEGHQDIGIFAVFDGHGGPEVAVYAKKYFLQCLITTTRFMQKQYEAALEGAFIMLDQMMLTPDGKQQLLQIRKQNAQFKNAMLYQGDTIAGCTALAILLTKQHIYCANAGDSKALASIKTPNNSFKYKDLSFEHKPWKTQQKIRIQAAGGKINLQGRINGNLNLSRALGDFLFKNNPNLNISKQMVIATPDIIKIQRQQLQFIILGCDGIWQSKTSEQMVKWIKKKRNPPTNVHLSKILQNLLDEELASGFNNDGKGVDNMSAILIWFNK